MIKMETVLGARNAKERTAMQRFGEGGVILPWTKQILGVLWEHLRLFVDVICYTLLAVFQMFRFEVHLRITDEAEHIQHMTSAAGDPTDRFLLSSLFENNANVSGDPFELNPRSRTVLSSLVNDEICCSLVDDFVSRATECLTENDRHRWKHSFDWNVITSSDSGYTDDVCPFTFTACVSNLYQNGTDDDGSRTELDCNVPFPSTEGAFGRRQEAGGQGSDSEVSWASSDSSLVEGEKEESDKLWDLLTKSTDPYHPLHFTACVSSATPNRRSAPTNSKVCQNSIDTKVVPYTFTSKRGNSGALPSEDEEETLWKSLFVKEDPYHPLNFRALHIPAAGDTHGHSENLTKNSPCCHDKKTDAVEASAVPRCRKHLLISKQVVSHKCPQVSVDKPFRLPWKRPINKTTKATTKGSPVVKRVTYSPVVHVHKMRVWSFALQASRKGPWEEHARDRVRFQRRILETERAIGYCFSLSHRENLSAHQQRTLSK